MSVKEFVLSLLQKKYSLEPNINLYEFNYIENGYVDSFGIVQFVLEIEEKYNIEFSTDEISSKQFQIVGSLIDMIETKIKEIEKNGD